MIIWWNVHTALLSTQFSFYCHIHYFKNYGDFQSPFLFPLEQSHMKAWVLTLIWYWHLLTAIMLEEKCYLTFLELGRYFILQCQHFGHIFIILIKLQQQIPSYCLFILLIESCKSSTQHFTVFHPYVSKDEPISTDKMPFKAWLPNYSSVLNSAHSHWSL
jgi:hypothetical protein